MQFRKYLEHLDKNGKLVHIKKKVSVDYEIATLMKMLDGRPLLFEKVECYDMPVAANICSSRSLIAQGLQIEEKKLIQAMLQAINNPIEPEVIKANDYTTLSSLNDIPVLLHYPFDGGKYLSSAVVVSHDSEHGLNASYHRMMLFGDNEVVIRILPRDFNTYIERGLKEFAICIGNPISVAVASAISMPITENELAFANSLYPTPLVNLDGHTTPHSEIIMIAELTGEMHDEGPFLDLTETPDIVRKQRVAKIKKIYSLKNPVYHALLPGGLEHKTLMGTPKEPTIYHEVSKVSDVKDVHITPGGCSWLHAVVSIKKRHDGDGKLAIEAAFRGHNSLKHVFVVDDDIDIADMAQVEWAMATRFQGDNDLIMQRSKGSSLDPSANANTRETTKIGFDLTIPWGKGLENFKKPDLPIRLNPDDYF